MTGLTVRMIHVWFQNSDARKRNDHHQRESSRQGESYTQGRGNGLALEPTSRNPEGRGSSPHLGSRRSSLISIKYAELLHNTSSFMLFRAWLVTMALHVHCSMGQLSPLPTSGDDKWVVAKHCGRAKRSKINDTHRLRWSLQFCYINNQSLLLTLLLHRLLFE